MAYIDITLIQPSPTSISQRLMTNPVVGSQARTLDLLDIRVQLMNLYCLECETKLRAIGFANLTTMAPWFLSFRVIWLQLVYMALYHHFLVEDEFLPTMDTYACRLLHMLYHSCCHEAELVQQAR